MNREALTCDAFDRARQMAAGDPDLLELILWIELLSSLGVSATAACTTWAGQRSRTPLAKNLGASQ